MIVHDVLTDEQRAAVREAVRDLPPMDPADLDAVAETLRQIRADALERRIRARVDDAARDLAGGARGPA